MFSTVISFLAGLVVFIAARTISRVAGAHRWFFSHVLFVGLIVVLPVAVTRITADYFVALAIVGVTAAVTSLALRPRLVVPPDEPHERPHAFAIIIAGVGAALVLWSVFDSYLYDEIETHIPLANVMLRGVAPPEHPLYLGEPFRYHYGFPALVTFVRQSTGLGVIRAIDVATTYSYGLVLAACWHVGRAFAGRIGGSVTLALVPLMSSPFLFLFYQNFGDLEFHWNALPATWWDHWQDTMPPTISSFFQHPQGLGMPMSIAALLLMTDAQKQARVLPSRFLLGAAILAFTWSSQAVYFAMTGLGVGVATLVAFVMHRQLVPLLARNAVLIGCLVVAFLTGGFAEGGLIESAWAYDRGHFDDTGLTLLLRNVLCFGFPFVAIPLYVFRIRGPRPQLRVALLVLIGIGFAVPNLMRYRHAWDIVKFFAVGGLFASILFADLVTPIFNRRRRFLAALLTVVVTWSSWIFLVRVSVMNGRGAPAMFGHPDVAFGELLARELDGIVGPYDRVLTSARTVGDGGGFLTPGVNNPPLPFAFHDADRVPRYYGHAVRARRDLGQGDLDALEIAFVLIAPSERARLSSNGRRALADEKRFTEVHTVDGPGGAWVLYRVRRPR